MSERTNTQNGIFDERDVERLLREPTARRAPDGLGRRVMASVADERAGAAPAGVLGLLRTLGVAGLGAAAVLALFLTLGPVSQTTPGPVAGPVPDPDQPGVTALAERYNEAVGGGLIATRRLVTDARGAATEQLEAVRRDAMLVARRFEAALDMAAKPFSNKDL